MKKLALFLFSSLLHSAAVQAEALDRIVAIVNNTAITQTEVNQHISLVKQQFAQATQIPEADLNQQVLDRLILDKIELQLAEQSGILIDEPTVDEAIQQMLRNQRLSLDQLKTQLNQEGLSFEQFRHNIRHELAIHQLQKKTVGHEIAVSEREVEQYLKTLAEYQQAHSEYRLRHILIALPPSPTPEQIRRAETEATELLAQIRQGADFSSLAVRYSKGQQALEGGDLGWRKGSELPTLFTKNLQTLKVGAVDGLYRNASGFHLIQLADKRQAYADISPVQSHVRHVLIKTSLLNTPEEAYQQIQLVRALIQSGQPFEKVAQEKSEDTLSKTTGGDLGWLSAEHLSPEFRQVMNRLPEHTLSEPFQTAAGWHLIEVLERRELSTDPELLRQKALTALQTRKFEEQLIDWQRQIRDQAFVRILTPDHTETPART